MAVLLSPKRVRRNIEAMPDKELRERAIQRLEQEIAPRHGSETYARKLTSQGQAILAVTVYDKEEMARMKANKASYRTIESDFRLFPSEGMGVYRCVKDALRKNRILRKELKPIAKRNGVTLPKLVG